MQFSLRGTILRDLQSLVALANFHLESPWLGSCIMIYVDVGRLPKDGITWITWAVLEAIIIGERCTQFLLKLLCCTTDWTGWIIYSYLNIACWYVLTSPFGMHHNDTRIQLHASWLHVTRGKAKCKVTRPPVSKRLPFVLQLSYLYVY